MHQAGLFGTGISDACGLSAGFGGGPAGDGTVCGQANPAGENRRWVLLRILVAAFVAVGMLRHFLPTLRYSYALPFEQESERLRLVGTVAAVEACPDSPRYYLGESNAIHRASIVEIDGETFYFLDAGGLQPNMQVEILYFPESKMVTDCQVVE